MRAVYVDRVTPGVPKRASARVFRIVDRGGTRPS
jgi:hypothetical protein